jgi:ATP/maltotriose-dependent transcriptional regulator MalT
MTGSKDACIRAGNRGGTREMSRFAAGVESLTRTEAHVLALVDSGLSNREIAATLSITVGTVKCHLHRVYEKLQVTSRLEAVAKAREDGDLALPVRTTASVRAPVPP